MKKRIKLTDKELAIGMWVYICLYIESYNAGSKDHKMIASLKRIWLEKHYITSYVVSVDFHWNHDCWFCHKHWKCHCLDCPLGQCGSGSLYEGVTEYYQSKAKQAKALKCAKKILNVILVEKEEEGHEEENDD